VPFRNTAKQRPGAVDPPRIRRGKIASPSVVDQLQCLAKDQKVIGSLNKVTDPFLIALT